MTNIARRRFLEDSILAAAASATASIPASALGAEQRDSFLLLEPT
jgi:hypothetical protein